jgi:hypothetical protein
MFFRGFWRPVPIEIWPSNIAKLEPWSFFEPEEHGRRPTLDGVMTELERSDDDEAQNRGDR